VISRRAVFVNDEFPSSLTASVCVCVCVCDLIYLRHVKPVPAAPSDGPDIKWNRVER